MGRWIQEHSGPYILVWFQGWKQDVALLTVGTSVNSEGAFLWGRAFETDSPAGLGHRSGANTIPFLGSHASISSGACYSRSSQLACTFHPVPKQGSMCWHPHRSASQSHLQQHPLPHPHHIAIDGLEQTAVWQGEGWAELWGLIPNGISPWHCSVLVGLVPLAGAALVRWNICFHKETHIVNTLKLILLCLQDEPRAETLSATLTLWRRSNAWEEIATGEF